MVVFPEDPVPFLAYTHGSSQQSVTLVSGGLKLSSDFQGHQTHTWNIRHTWYTDIPCRQNIHYRRITNLRIVYLSYIESSRPGLCQKTVPNTKNTDG